MEIKNYKYEEYTEETAADFTGKTNYHGYPILEGFGTYKRIPVKATYVIAPDADFDMIDWEESLSILETTEIDTSTLHKLSSDKLLEVSKDSYPEVVEWWDIEDQSFDIEWIEGEDKSEEIAGLEINGLEVNCILSYGHTYYACWIEK